MPIEFPFWLAPLETEIEPVYKYNQGFLMRYRTPEVPSSSLSSQISKNSQESQAQDQGLLGYSTSDKT